MTACLVIAVAFIAVPALLQLLESLLSFDPVGYEPRDFARERFLNLRGVTDVLTGPEAYLSIGFLALCALFFMLSRKD